MHFDGFKTHTASIFESPRRTIIESVRRMSAREWVKWKLFFGESYCSNRSWAIQIGASRQVHGWYLTHPNSEFFFSSIVLRVRVPSVPQLTVSIPVATDASGAVRGVDAEDALDVQRARPHRVHRFGISRSVAWAIRGAQHRIKTLGIQSSESICTWDADPKRPASSRNEIIKRIFVDLFQFLINHNEVFGSRYIHRFGMIYAKER